MCKASFRKGRDARQPKSESAGLRTGLGGTVAFLPGRIGPAFCAKLMKILRNLTAKINEWLSPSG